MFFFGSDTKGKYQDTKTGSNLFIVFLLVFLGEKTDSLGIERIGILGTH